MTNPILSHSTDKVDLDLFVSIWNRYQGMTTPAVHLKILTWMQVQIRMGRQKMLLMAFRSCGKSTLVGLFAAWLLYQNRDCRILVLAAEESLAVKMVRNVKRIIERHPLTQGMKPDAADQWASGRFTVRRDSELRDPSMLARGITGNITGTRADIVICDDVEVPNTSETQDKREELRERLREVSFILGAGGMQFYIGTPHHSDTIYNTCPAGFLSAFNALRVPIRDGNGCSAWPERFDTQAIEQMETASGPRKFAAQMMLEPTDIREARLNPELLRFYQDDLVYQEARGRPILMLGSRRLVSCAAWWDPAFGAAVGDRSVLAVLYMCGGGEYWLQNLAVIKNNPDDTRDEATQQAAQVARILRDYHVPAMHLETNGIGRFLPAILRRELKSVGHGCAVIEMHQSRHKDQRILEGFDALLAARVLHIHERVKSTPFIGEMRDWQPGGSAGHDDCLDAVAGALLTQPVRIGSRYADGAGDSPAKRPDWTDLSTTFSTKHTSI